MLLLLYSFFAEMSSSSRYRKSRHRSRTRSKSPPPSKSKKQQHSTDYREPDRVKYASSSEFRSRRGEKGARESSHGRENSNSEARTEQNQHPGDRPKSNRSREFDIKSCKSFFDKMFFRIYDVIVKGSPQHEDFWKFYDKIQNIQRLRQVRVGSTSRLSTAGELEDSKGTISIGRIQVPEKYSKKLTVPFRLMMVDTKDYITRLNPGQLNYLHN
jgi:hypothetical protein